MTCSAKKRLSAVADHRYRAEQRDDHLGAPERHLPPRQHVAHEGFGHQHQVDQHAEDPHQLARLLVAAVQQAAEHVQVDHDEEQRGPGGVHVADQPAPLHVTHDVFDGTERLGGVGLVVHRQEDAGDDLVDQHQQRQRTEVVPDVEVLRRVVLADMLAVHRHQARRAGIDPGGDAAGGTAEDIGHQAAPCGSTPMMMVLSSW
ncbi:hypothetical protein G6F68_012565 [Rhizopus microsporus]|nr:hypothetical protein G6F68_012565 [Rhizopus microsporus]